MIFQPGFPTRLHQDVAEIIRDYFSAMTYVDTVLIVNSCARGQAVPESDLDFAILVQPGTSQGQVTSIGKDWQTFSETQPTFIKYKRSSQFAYLHLDIITGNYAPAEIQNGEPVDYFEIEIGNQVCYAAPMNDAGLYFRELQNRWLPYYNEKLRLQRFQSIKTACNYDLDHIPFFIKRELYFQAFDILCKAFQEYLQALFIANKTYPIAYNKWIKEQVVKWLNKPALYKKLPPVLSINNIESNQINDRVKDLRVLLNDLS